MANEIYDSTWWGNTIDTASSIGTSTEMIQGQFNMLTSNQPNLVVNGDFAANSDWTLGTGWSIGDGKAVATNAPSGQKVRQLGRLTAGKTYKLVYEVTEITLGGFLPIVGAVAGTAVYSIGTYTEYITTINDDFYIRALSTTSGSITNISVKEVRAEEVEAVKCLADAIHRIGIQDIQN